MVLRLVGICRGERQKGTNAIGCEWCVMPVGSVEGGTEDDHRQKQAKACEFKVQRVLRGAKRCCQCEYPCHVRSLVVRMVQLSKCSMAF
jgi:hypothetical protein